MYSQWVKLLFLSKYNLDNGFEEIKKNTIFYQEIWQ
ncbi:hypothetical protein X474_14565 [Dethiosulfatarculus sandiegensis]|uniref:Uncharacterized protein n=1 Tax=Dethiosulfatarculus sandiegensis TaxID=1429043 RepID=A0A0D2JUN5_9BACT|nr:hypothetical protein X474_14565 [Dethiosulfatarculus sandiegensis]